MNLLNRYILAQFTRTFFTVAAGFVAIYILVDFFEKIDNFMRAGQSVTMLAKFFLLNIPFIVDQLGPILILLSGVVTLGLLTHNNELTAIMASGIHLRTIVNPILIGGILYTMIFLAMAQWLLPYTIAATNTIWYEKVNNMIPLGIYRNGRFYYRGQDGFYSFARPWLDKDIFRNFSYSSWNNNHNLQSLITADKAEYKDKTWMLSKGQIQRFVRNIGYTTTLFDEKNFNFPEAPESFFVPKYQAAELSLTELFHDSINQKSERETFIAKTNFYSRVSYALLGIPLLVLGLPILLLSYRKWGRDLSVAIPVSCGMAFVAWGLWGALQSLAKAGLVTPFFAAIFIHFLFGIVGFVILHRQGT